MPTITWHVLGGLGKAETAKENSILECSSKYGQLDIWVIVALSVVAEVSFTTSVVHRTSALFGYDMLASHTHRESVKPE